MSKKDVVQSHIEVLMQQFLEVDHLHVDDDGDIPVRAGNAVYTVRVAKHEQINPHVEAYAIVVDDVDADPGLYEALNSLNRRLSHSRAFWTDRKVVLAGEVVGVGLELPALGCLCEEIAMAANHEGPALAKTFGGTTGCCADGEDA